MARAPYGGYLDRFGNEWTNGLFRTQGQAFEWGLQLKGDLTSSGGLLNAASTVEQYHVVDNRGTTTRGFTGHEHLDDVQLIHMNGRVLGRFLSVDPFIQGNGNSQGLNPYSYILNNPLAGKDPSGYSCQTVDEGKGCGEAPEPAPEKKKRPNIDSICKVNSSCQIIDYAAARKARKDNGKTKNSKPTGQADSIGSQSQRGQQENVESNWTPKYLKIYGVEVEELSSEDLEVLQALDQAISEYRNKLLTLIAHGEYVEQAQEALRAFDETSWEYHHVENDDVAQGSLSWTDRKSFDLFKKMYKKDRSFFNGERKVKYFKGIIDVYRHGLSSSGQGSIASRARIYDSIPKGVAGLRKITYHEASHTIVSRMYDAKKSRFMKQWGRGGFEVKADKWSRIIGGVQ
ncbi:MAG: hypothetical protein D6694_10845 [Gammaproteobacteria bacterium]|nr:MAG: hypothetical protein D6694_10845 [Gammaproteobacteria bacterium]